MTTPDAFRDAEYLTDVSGILDVEDCHHVVSGDLPASTTNTYLSRKAQKAAKIRFIDSLLRDLDILIYCELSALYYMDCSLILFAIRAIVQLVFFTPKQPPFSPTRNQPFIGAIFGSNLLCILLHILFVHPDAPEETGGYLHGGLFIDFIGQSAPVSRLRLVIFDTVLMFLHLIMLGLTIERVRLGSGPFSSPTGPTAAGNTNNGQDHDAEERGIRRGDVDMHYPLNRTEDNVERTELVAEPVDDGSEQPARGSHPLDIFASGEALILDMGILNTIQDQWSYNPQAAPRAQLPPSPETASFLRRHFGLEVGPDGRLMRIQR